MLQEDFSSQLKLFPLVLLVVHTNISMILLAEHAFSVPPIVEAALELPVINAQPV